MVVCAHNTYDNFILQRITDIFGSVGVPIFLIRSGFFLNQHESTKTFWLKKLKSIVIPWVIISLCLYLFCIRKNLPSFNLLDCFLFCIGYGTWLYYIFILLVYYAAFRLLREEWFLYVAISLFILSNVLDVYGVNWLSNITTPYLNFFNRIGYFAIGVIFKKTKLFDYLMLNKVLSVICASLVLPLGLLFIWWWNGILPSLLLIVYRLLFVYFVFIVANQISKNKILISIGKDTYLIYFLHLQFGLGLASHLLRSIHVSNQILIFLFKPFIALISILVGIIILRKLVSLLRLERFAWIVGLRVENKAQKKVML